MENLKEVREELKRLIKAKDVTNNEINAELSKLKFLISKYDVQVHRIKCLIDSLEEEQNEK